ncbi:serine hydrolase [Marivirga sp.]|uniref:serine hydrolase domain-containing protein n=1 Tax=Marivirga sp. TaxID=2018662 RepID=UPI0025CFD20F|nr:serine hydrolase [Marivirga sp.]
MINLFNVKKQVLFIFVSFFLGGDLAYSQNKNEALTRFTTTELQQKGWDIGKFQLAHKHVDSTGTAAYLLIQDGKIVDSYGDITRKYQCHSIRKSFLSALYGIYLQRKEIDTSKTLFELGIGEYVPLSPLEQTASLRDLIMGRSGVFLPATYENEGFDKVRPERNAYSPGRYWFYSNWDFNTAGTAFMLETGQNIFSAFKKEIADAIGMQDFEFNDGIWRYSPRSQHPAYLFRMSTRDMARFGLLFLNKGKWKDKQLIPEKWVKESTAFHSNVTKPDGSPLSDVGFGYMWWTSNNYFKGSGLKIGKGAFNASGTGTQAIYIMPEENMVFVHRVNTDLPSKEYQSVNENEIGKLLELILEARKTQ